MKSTAALAVVAIALASCITPVSPESMSPGMLERPAQRGDRTLRVMPVTGADAPKPMSMGLEGGYYVGNDELDTALVDALDASGIFRKVTTSEPADFELRTHVISQKSQHTSYTRVTSVLVVNYRLRDVARAQDVWSETITSRSNEGAALESFFGTNRRALSAAAQQNLTAMLKRIPDAIP